MPEIPKQKDRRGTALGNTGTGLVLSALGTSISHLSARSEFCAIQHAREPIDLLTQRDRRVFFEAGCAFCRVVQGRGGRYGAELTDVADRRSCKAIPATSGQ